MGDLQACVLKESWVAAFIAPLHSLVRVRSSWGVRIRIRVPDATPPHHHHPTPFLTAPAPSFPSSSQGRTGAVICSYLLLAGQFLINADGSLIDSSDTAADMALEFFLSQRGEGITNACQERTVKYFAKVRGANEG